MLDDSESECSICYTAKIDLAQGIRLRRTSEGKICDTCLTLLDAPQRNLSNSNSSLSNHGRELLSLTEDNVDEEVDSSDYELEDDL